VILFFGFTLPVNAVIALVGPIEVEEEASGISIEGQASIGAGEQKRQNEARRAFKKVGRGTRWTVMARKTSRRNERLTAAVEIR
jgi:hypothetical protein